MKYYKVVDFSLLDYPLDGRLYLVSYGDTYLIINAMIYFHCIIDYAKFIFVAP